MEWNIKAIIDKQDAPTEIDLFFLKQVMAHRLADQMVELLISVYRHYPIGAEGFDNLWVISDHVTIDEWPHAYIDYSKVPVCWGDLPPAIGAKAGSGRKYVEFSWDYDEGLWSGRCFDKSILVAYSEHQGKFFFNPWGPRRYKKRAKLKIDKSLMGTEVHTWLGFLSKKRGLSYSVYTGKVRVM
jgi:hypothetical protein